jgi:CIC family chloride channel protein
MKMKRSPKSVFISFIKSSQQNTNLALPLTIASIVGAVTGFAIVGFVKLIDWMEVLFMDKLPHALPLPSLLASILILGSAGLVIGVVSHFLVPNAREQGVPEVLKCIALKGGKIPALSVLARMITSVIAIGTGFSVGREGPAVHLGAGIGANIARLFRLTELRRKNLAACGAAAGIAAVFNAPITGVMFALEVILRDFGARALSTVVVAAVAASIVSRIFLGDSPAFTIPVYNVTSSWEILLFVVLGFLAALVAVFFTWSTDYSDRMFEKIKLPRYLKPMIGGLMVAVIGFFFPQVFGMGFRVIEQMLHGSLPLQLLLSLVFVKVIATVCSLASGSTGGTFAPTLFVGGALGGAFGNLLYGRFPFEVSSSGAYALVGMASVFSGAFHAPVTAILLVFEMTGDYQMILPLMLAAVVSASVATALKKESIDTVKFKREGIDIEAVDGAGLLSAILVADAMSKDFVTVPRHLSAKTLIEKMAQEKDKTFYVIDEKENLTGAIRTKAMQALLFDENLDIIVADDIAEPIDESCFEDDPMSEAARIMKRHHMSQLPIVSSQDSKKIIGVIRSKDIFKAYTDVAVNRDDLISRMEQDGSHAEGATHLRFKVHARSKVTGKAIQEIHVPTGVILTSVQRRNETVIPVGSTVLQRGDKIWAVVLSQSREAFKIWVKENGLN